MVYIPEGVDLRVEDRKIYLIFLRLGLRVCVAKTTIQNTMDSNIFTLERLGKVIDASSELDTIVELMVATNDADGCFTDTYCLVLLN